MNTTHGESGHHNPSKLFIRWSGMIGRCHVKSHGSYKKYGARGITVCRAWRHDFVAFRDWALANGFRPELTIDRKNNSLGYSPSNCRWVTMVKNQSNRSNSIIFPGGKTTAEVASSLGVTIGAIHARLSKGISMKDTMAIPAVPNGGARRWFKEHHAK